MFPINGDQKVVEETMNQLEDLTPSCKESEFMDVMYVSAFIFLHCLQTLVISFSFSFYFNNTWQLNLIYS